MTKHSSANVFAAYEMLLEELEAELCSLNEAGAQAFKAGDHARAQELLSRVQKLTALHSELTSWAERLRPLVIEPRPKAQQGRLPDGAKTPDQAYRVPILSTLVAMGGTGEVAVVLDRVYELMKDQLNEYDLALLSSGRVPRWRNTAQWCRNTMREEGLIEAGSPHGIWEITDKGRAWLRAQG